MATGVAKAGFMEKLGGGGLKKYQNRYFVIRGSTLYWYKRRGDQNQSGSVLLQNTALLVAEDSLFLRINSTKKQYILKLSSEDDKVEWVEAMASVGAVPVQYREEEAPTTTRKGSKGKLLFRKKRVRSISDSAASRRSTISTSTKRTSDSSRPRSDSNVDPLASPTMPYQKLGRHFTRRNTEICLPSDELRRSGASDAHSSPNLMRTGTWVTAEAASRKGDSLSPSRSLFSISSPRSPQRVCSSSSSPRSEASSTGDVLSMTETFSNKKTLEESIGKEKQRAPGVANSGEDSHSDSDSDSEEEMQIPCLVEQPLSPRYSMRHTEVATTNSPSPVVDKGKRGSKPMRDIFANNVAVSSSFSTGALSTIAFVEDEVTKCRNSLSDALNMDESRSRSSTFCASSSSITFIDEDGSGSEPHLCRSSSTCNLEEAASREASSSHQVLAN